MRKKNILPKENRNKTPLEGPAGRRFVLVHVRSQNPKHDTKRWNDVGVYSPISRAAFLLLFFYQVKYFFSKCVAIALYNTAQLFCSIASFLFFVFFIFLWHFSVNIRASGPLLVFIEGCIIKSDWLPDGSICHMLFDTGFVELRGQVIRSTPSGGRSTSMTLFKN